MLTLFQNSPCTEAKQRRKRRSSASGVNNFSHKNASRVFPFGLFPNFCFFFGARSFFFALESFLPFYLARTAFDDSVMTENRGNRSEKTFTVKHKTDISDIFAVIFRFFGYFKFVSSVDLCPTRQAGSDVVRAVLIAFLDKIVLVPKSGARTSYLSSRNNQIIAPKL